VVFLTAIEEARVELLQAAQEPRLGSAVGRASVSMHSRLTVFAYNMRRSARKEA
jgi:hypothetical protein